MNLFEHFSEDEQPAQDWSLAEEAALHAPPLWAPAHVEPEGVTPLPWDFAVADPFLNPRVEKFKSLMAEYAVCKTHNCALDDRETLVTHAGMEAAEAIGELRAVCVALWAHGETLAAEAIAAAVDSIVNDILKPLLESAGVPCADDADDE